MFNFTAFSPVTSFNVNRLNQTAVGIGNVGNVSNTALVLQQSNAGLIG